jgi:hypothetical protein
MLLRSTFGALALSMLTAGPVMAAASGVTLTDSNNQYTGTAANPFTTSVQPFTTVTPFTVGGAAVLAGRSTAANCSVAGNVTYTMAGGGSYTVPVVVGWTNFPFGVTGASASTATCTYVNLN